MNPKDKARELVEKYNILLSIHVFNGTYDIAKQCAILSVDEIIESWNEDLYENCGASKYWIEVRKEIEKL